MKIESKHKVYNRLETVKNMSPLVFYDGVTSSSSPLFGDMFGEAVDIENLKEVVHRILKCMQRYWSQNERGDRETMPKRRRSSIDIFRHVLSVRPDVTIFVVMETLHDMVTNENDWTQSYCTTIQRRVFFPKDGLSGHRPRENSIDEFDLFFEDWSK